MTKTYARTALAYGTNTTIVIVTDNKTARVEPVDSIAIELLRRFISTGARGIKLSALSGYEVALADLGRLGLRFSRSHCTGTMTLVGTVQVVDQRTFQREAA